ncbi:MAG: tRNA ((32)/uridine(32)-2-O)-methyltransferase TrmJ [Gammaproteobacteria bacterium]|jgi:tRNA (cytidine32/uridine32-2'-O)-methyltransferase|nr:tRNA ((32)/uridine(32)-2-O)-methyltransferase TrmJ [Gammaproteobacteria bacterium]
MLTNIRIVLIGTKHPGNIGAAARAMKTMGLRQLYLVNPVEFPSSKAVAMSSNADDLLAEAIVVNNLEQALSGCSLVVGTSARQRKLPWPLLAPRECAELMIKHATTQTVALVFGREDTGLLNEELDRCHYHVTIPANPEYSSLNLAAAVQVLSYELRVASLNEPVNHEPLDDEFALASAEYIEKFYQHLEAVLYRIRFLDSQNAERIMRRLRRLFSRTVLERKELNILRGILVAVTKQLD